MTKGQSRSLRRIFSEIFKNNMAWRESKEVAAIFGGRRVGPQILEAIDAEWLEYMNEREDELEPFDWQTPVLRHRRFAGGWLAFSIAIDSDSRWLPCAA